MKSIFWSAGESDENVSEIITFEYGGLVITVYNQDTAGNSNIFQNGRNRIRNVSDNSVTTVII